MGNGFFKRFLCNSDPLPGGGPGDRGGSGGSSGNQWNVTFTDTANVINATNLLGPVENLDNKYYIDNLIDNATLLLIPSQGG